MFTDPISITYDGTSYDLSRTNQDNHGSTYFHDSGSVKFKLNVAHTIPNSPGLPGEQHHVRLYVEHYDAEGVYLRSSSPWMTIKAMDSPQVTAEALLASNALVAFLTSTNVEKLLAREV